MKLLLTFPPFNTPTSPPFGLAYLKAAIGAVLPEVETRLADWNLAFFNRWLDGGMPDPCAWHPQQLLGTTCPSLIPVQGRGRSWREILRRTPHTPEEQAAYMDATRQIDDFYRRLGSFYHDILFPFVEGRRDLPPEAEEAIFGPELAETAAFGPDLLGFSILTEHNLLYALALGKVIRRRLGVPILLGGAMASHLEAPELLRAFPWIEAVFSGEAEDSLPRFLAVYPDGDVESVPGLAHHYQGHICEHPGEAHPPLSALPIPDFSDYPLGEYLVPEPVLPVITSRGCYWGKCTFCSHTLPYGGGVRVRKPEAVLDEIETQMARYGGRHFLFVDEAISPRMMRSISRGILDRGLDVRFGMEGVRVEGAFDHALLEQAHQAGLRWIYVGIESSVQRLLDRTEKGIRIETIEQLIADCQAVGILPELSFIVGLPGTTPEEMIQEIAFMRRYPVDSSSFVLLKGSPLEARAAEFGVRLEARQVLYRTNRGVVHAPRFDFSVGEGLSPVQADHMVEAAGPRPRLRPHLGEVHATLLADTDFFTSQERPPAPPDGAALAIETLRGQQIQGQTESRWFIHMASALETQERFEAAFTIAQAGMSAADGESRPALALHLAAISGFGGQPGQAWQLLSRMPQAPKALRPALAAEKARAAFALEQPGEVVRAAEAALAGGLEIPGIYLLLGLSYEALGRHKKALDALEAAARRDSLEPEIHFARARCLRVLKREPEAGEAQARGRRLLVYLGDGF